MMAEKAIRPPFPLPFLEPFRALQELSTQPAGNYILGFAPSGDGHPVLTMPGFLGGDRSMSLVRRYLRQKNFDPYTWNLGQNRGPHTSGEDGADVDARINEIFEKTGRKVSIVGWSLGGVMARNAGRRMPEKIRQIITLGSPFEAERGSSSIAPLFKAISGHDPDAEEIQEMMDYNRPPPPLEVPTTAIFTKTDGVVHWRGCVERPAPNTDNIEVMVSHVGLAFSPIVQFLLAERLAQPEGEWGPFDREAQMWRRVTFPSSGHVYGF